VLRAMVEGDWEALPDQLAIELHYYAWANDQPVSGIVDAANDGHQGTCRALVNLSSSSVAITVVDGVTGLSLIIELHYYAWANDW
jgi:hypothetical protein